MSNIIFINGIIWEFFPVPSYYSRQIRQINNNTDTPIIQKFKSTLPVVRQNRYKKINNNQNLVNDKKRT